MSFAILYDSTLCVGCKACEQGCTEKWGMPYNEQVAAEERISAHKLTVVQTFGDKYSRKLCMHCQDPTCASVCPVKALQKTPEGPVVYDESRCFGCRYCMQACPFQVPTYEWSSRNPRVKKCNMCVERQTKGQKTACTETCPTGATICGQRDDLIAEARRRLAGKPSDYYQKIYGIREAGGTSVLYLSAVPFEQIGLRTNLPNEPLPALTWRALSVVPDIAAVGVTLLGGIWWITHRREDVAKEEAREQKGGRP
jgi:formate dehydrogenase iron-sulfur subunit